MSECTLRTTADTSNLAQIRRFVREAVAALGVAPETTYSLELAIDEAACNSISHGYQGRAGLIEVDVEHDGDVVTIRLRDWAPPFDPTSAPEPDLTLPLEERPYGGLGVYLIRRSVDEVIYRALPGGGNELTLKKRLKKEGDHGDSHV